MGKICKICNKSLPHDPVPLIIKVQQSQFPDNQSILVYDETKKYWYQGPLTKQVKRFMKGAQKIYCEATVIDHEIQVNKRIEDQGW